MALAGVAAVAEFDDDVVQLFKGDEPATVEELVVVDGFGEFGDFRPLGGAGITELAAFGDAVFATLAGASIDECRGGFELWIQKFLHDCFLGEFVRRSRRVCPATGHLALRTRSTGHLLNVGQV